MSQKVSPKVSVCLITYNHSRFIRKAIDGVLMQSTTFPIELIIADDCSTDGTREILLEYQQLRPDIVKLILQTVNVGPAQNWFDLITSPTGEYIAYFEGDDYWVDPLKLQKQSDFLDANKDFAICFHNARILDESKPDDISYSNPVNQPGVTTIHDLAIREYISTPTCMFRRADFEKYPRSRFRYMNNYTMDLHNAQYGKIKYFPEAMSVYRRHAGGIWSMVAREKTIKNHLPSYIFYLSYFDKDLYPPLLNQLQSIISEIVNIKFLNKSLSDFWHYYLLYLRYNWKKSGALRYALGVGSRMLILQLKGKK